MSVFASYKPGQARLSRLVTLLSGLFLVVWGGRSLTLAIPRLEPGLGEQLVKGWTVPLIVVPDQNFSVAFLVGAVTTLVGLFLVWRLLERPKIADALIEMETELRKVSWPTPGDAWKSTLVVTVFTLSVVVVMLVYDLVIKNFIELFVRKVA